MSDFMSLVKTASSPQDFYHAFNRVYEKYAGEYLMLHYPFYRGVKEDLLQAQKNLVDYCIRQVLPVANQTMLDVGCGNGIQAMYVYSMYNPAKMIGIDLNEESIAIANVERDRRKLSEVSFHVANAQDMSCVPDGSIDVLINIESAMHYPDKTKFLGEIHRVLKPGGRFVIADLLTKRDRRKPWEKRMVLHHWNLARYERELEKSPLILLSIEEITPHVIGGFRMNRYWFGNLQHRQVDLIWKILIRLWAKGFVLWMLYLFHSFRSYHLFVGQKRSA
jgi:ubiquinone/menaquinone biosynthesis C-methylase UbiE